MGALGDCGADPKAFLRTCFGWAPGAEEVLAALLVLPGGEEKWLARASSADAAAREGFVGLGLDLASTAHGVDLPLGTAFDEAVGLQTVRNDEGLELHLLLCGEDESREEWEWLDALPCALLVFQQQLHLEQLSAERHHLHRRLEQVRAGLRAGVQASRVFHDLGAAGDWLVDLRTRFSAHAVALILEDPHDVPLMLSQVQSTSSLQADFLSRCVAEFVREHRQPWPQHLRWRNLDLSGWDRFCAPEERGGGDSGLEDPWPSFLAVALKSDGGRGALVVLAARLPQTFAPEAAEMLRSTAGSVAHALGHVLDQEQQRRQQLQRILELLPVGLVLVEDGGRVGVVNSEARQLLEIEGEITKLDDLELRTGMRWKDLFEEIRDRRSGQPGQTILELPGRNLPLDIQSLGWSDPITEKRTWLLTLRDVSAEQRRERARAEFVSTVGHELKTPLTSMQTALELLVGGEVGEVSADQRHFIEMTLRGVHRMGHRVEQLLNMAREEAGRLVLHRESVEAGEVFGPIFDDLELRAEREGRVLIVDLPLRARCYLDRSRAGEILENLVGNAFKFCPRRREVRCVLRTEMPAPDLRLRELAALIGLSLRGIEIEVRDRGSGMSPTTVHHAFDPFYQEGDPLSDRPEGAGLGLAIVRSLVDGHDGEITIESRVGEGTTFRVWIPETAEVAGFLSTVKILRARVEEAWRRAESLHLNLYAPPGGDPSSEEASDTEAVYLPLGEAWTLRCGSSSPAAGRGGVAAVSLPEDGRRAGTLLAELLQRANPYGLPSGDPQPGKASHD